MSDQQKGLIPAIQEFFPQAEHRNCARHIYANFRKRHSGSKLRKMFWQASKCSTREEFARTMQQIKGVSNGAFTWIMNQDPHLWSRAFFDTQTNCVNVENNMSEAFNGFILEAREKPIINMLEDIRLASMIRVSKKLKDISKDPHDPICPRVREKLEENKKNYRFWTCSHNIVGKFEVRHGEIGYVIDMVRLTWSCRMWQLSGIPCEHAINAIYFQNDSPDKYVAHWFFKDAYLKTYSNCLQPMNGHNMWPISTIEPVLPPEKRRAPVRPKRQRRKEFHEQPRPGTQISRRGKAIRCTKCQEEGHNRLTCKNETVEITKDLPRPRGRPRKKVASTTPSTTTAPKERRGRKKKQSTAAVHNRMDFVVYTDEAGNTYINGFLIPNDRNQGEGNNGQGQPGNDINIEVNTSVPVTQDASNERQPIDGDVPVTQDSINGDNIWASL